MSKFEIHMHSIFSDGQFSPTELVEIAQKNGLSDLSLTDHDTFEGIDELVSAAEGTGIHAFPGIEITTRFRDFNLHLLAYFKNMDSNPKNGDPLFNNESSGTKFGYQLKSGSAAINAGVAKQGPPIPGAGMGVFKDLTPYPTKDFYGNPINLSTGTPNIGACNAKNGEIHTN